MNSDGIADGIYNVTTQMIDLRGKLAMNATLSKAAGGLILASTDSFRRLQRRHRLGLASEVERRGGNVFQHLAKDDDVDGQ